jgi:hypothetical protein
MDHLDVWKRAMMMALFGKKRGSESGQSRYITRGFVHVISKNISTTTDLEFLYNGDSVPAKDPILNMKLENS